MSGEAGTGMQGERTVMFGKFPAGVVRGACWRMAMKLQADTSSVMGREVLGGDVFREAVGSVF